MIDKAAEVLFLVFVLGPAACRMLKDARRDLRSINLKSVNAFDPFQKTVF